jgi:thiol-disulfide isomerase/thioredoxin
MLTISVSDAFGDGMCCAYGNGGYVVKLADCNVVASGGVFTNSDSKSFSVTPVFTYDASVTKLDLRGYLGFGSHPITGELINVGSSAITSMELNYTINGGTPVVQSITGINIPPCGTYAFTHASDWAVSMTGSYNVEVYASNLNGIGDQYPLNDKQIKNTDVYEAVSIRTPLVEDFGSSTCPPCASLAQFFDPTLEDYFANVPGSAKVHAIKYQMNWPSPGNDPSYNPDGVSRRSYYSVSGIPSTWADGLEVDGSSTDIDDAAEMPAFMDIAVTTTIVGNQLTANVIITPLVDFTSSSLVLHVAATEDRYTYTGGTTSQTVFDQIMRKMLPDGNGTSLGPLTANSPVGNSFSYTFTLGGVAQGNYNLWTDMDNLTVLAWVQDNSTKEVLQSAVESSSAMGIEDELNEVVTGFNVFPNPTQGLTSVMLETADRSNVNMQVINAVGQTVFADNMGLVPAGRHIFEWNAEGNAEGFYFVRLAVDDHVITRRVAVTR